MANKLYSEESIQAIADAIRTKNGSSNTYNVGEMASAILSLTIQEGENESDDTTVSAYELTTGEFILEEDFQTYITSSKSNPFLVEHGLKGNPIAFAIWLDDLSGNEEKTSLYGCLITQTVAMSIWLNAVDTGVLWTNSFNFVHNNITFPREEDNYAYTKPSGEEATLFYGLTPTNAFLAVGATGKWLRAGYKYRWMALGTN